ncbi:MAG: hypothetical protein U0R44_01570 [Candidatus Micrarchaeia archaeon]
MSRMVYDKYKKFREAGQDSISAVGFARRYRESHFKMNPEPIVK